MFFIAFEGLDGSGKSTLMKSLVRELNTRGIAFVETREPGGTKLAEHVRELVLKVSDEPPHARTEALLYQASRAQHVEVVIRPALKRGAWVLCDRFSASSIAFQSFARGLKLQDIESLNLFATDSILPELNVLLDLPVDESTRRLEQRNKKESTESDRLEQEARSFHEKVREGFLFQAKREPDKWLVLDATKSPEVLYENLLQFLVKRKWLH